MRALVVAMLVAFALPSSACINTFDAKLQSVQRYGNADSARDILQVLKQAHATTPTLENSNDLAVVYILTEKLDEAIKLLRETEKKFPGNARVAANLGTALELKGEDEEALKWIREGVIRDSGEHKGSEWLHVRILTAKIAHARDPQWFEKNHVLGYGFGADEVPVAPEILPFEKGKLKGGQELLNQINYQLAERRKFVNPPDAFVGDLLASAGDLAIAASLTPIDGGNEDATRYYEGALLYGAPHGDLVRKRLARYKADIAALPPPKPKEAEEVVEYPSATESLESSARMFWIFFVGAFSLAIGGIIVHMLRRKRIGG